MLSGRRGGVLPIYNTYLSIDEALICSGSVPVLLRVMLRVKWLWISNCYGVTGLRRKGVGGEGE